MRFRRAYLKNWLLPRSGLYAVFTINLLQSDSRRTRKERSLFVLHYSLYSRWAFCLNLPFQCRTEDFFGRVHWNEQARFIFFFMFGRFRIFGADIHIVIINSETPFNVFSNPKYDFILYLHGLRESYSFLSSTISNTS